MPLVMIAAADTQGQARAWRRARFAGRALVRALAVSLAALALCLVGVANAGAASLTIESPKGGQFVNTATPTFKGTTADEYNGLLETFDPVSVRIYEGTTVAGSLVQTTPATQPFTGPVWTVAAVESLPRPGTYTAEAVQASEHSEPVTFIVDTTLPPVVIEAPLNGSSTTGESQLFAGKAGSDEGDAPEVTIHLFAGSVAAGSPLESLTTKVQSESRWSIYGALAPGTYTAQATQEDAAGNVGASPPVTFTVAAPAAHPSPPPLVSFNWFPVSPVAGETVTIVSTSTDSTSPITSFAWDLAGNGPFRGGGPVLSTSFPTPGSHVVRLQVVDARGASGVATETIPVGSPPLKPMQPFPIVRIAGAQTGGGVRLTLVSVQAPVGARVTVTCRGRACRIQPQSRVASANKHNRHASSVVLTFGSFERSFRAGTTLEVRVSAPGEVGKYTLFAIHRRSLPTRVDECLSALDPDPVACAT